MTNATPVGFTPRFPNLTALGAHSIFVLALCLPMLAGQFLVGPHSDQYIVGHAIRQFWSDYVRAHGDVPLWNPYLFGGLPFVAAQHGDIFYVTSFLRVLLPTDTALNLAFAIHLVLAGYFTYLFLRTLGLPWGAALVGGIAYQLSGQIASLVHPGHDGKLIVSALLPLACWALVRGVRDGAAHAYGVLGLVVGFALLSPHYQSTYYLLMAAGVFALYLAFAAPDRPLPRQASLRLAAALGAVLAGVVVSAIQVLPFLEYLPYSPRSVPGSSSGWEYAISWSLPPEELINTVLPQFSGQVETYWGRNPIKLHSEYLGIVPLLLATVGLARPTRPALRWAFVAIAGLFLLVSLGGYTPFYRLVYELLPYMKKVRAPSMAFFIVSFAVAVWAALGVERLLTRRDEKVPGLMAWLIAVTLLFLLAASGVLTDVARGLADPGRAATAVAGRGALTLGAARVLVFALLAAGLLLAWRRGRVPEAAFTALVASLVGLDLFTVDRRYFVYSPPARELYAPDAITTRLATVPQPYRVLDAGGLYPGSTLMEYRVPQVLGYHGNEIRYYDDLMGGKNEWRNLGNPQLWRLLAVRFIVYPDSGAIPGFHVVLGPVTTPMGGTAFLYEADSVPPYAQVASGAVPLDENAIVPTLLDPRLGGFDRLVLYDRGQPVTPAPVRAIPPPSPVRATVSAWEPGRMSIALDPAPAGPSYLLVSENWYPDWRATVDGAPAQALRGNGSLITVPLAAGARRVDLAFRSDAYARGKLITLLTVAGLIALAVVPPVRARRRRA